MYEPIQEKRVKARFTHWCEWCGWGINKGTICVYRAYKFDGEFTSEFMHIECFDAMKSCDDISEGFEPGEFEQGTTNRIED